MHRAALFIAFYNFTKTIFIRSFLLIFSLQTGCYLRKTGILVLQKFLSGIMYTLDIRLVTTYAPQQFHNENIADGSAKLIYIYYKCHYAYRHPSKLPMRNKAVTRDFL